jgi:hypothetical protein
LTSVISASSSSATTSISHSALSSIELVSVMQAPTAKYSANTNQVTQSSSAIVTTHDLSTSLTSSSLSISSAHNLLHTIVASCAPSNSSFAIAHSHQSILSLHYADQSQQATHWIVPDAEHVVQLLGHEAARALMSSM